MNRFPYLTLILSAIALAIHATPGAAEALQLESDALARSEFWRLVTGHLTHFGEAHLRSDVIAFVAFGSLVEFRSRRSWLVCLSIAAVVISLSIVWLQPQFSIYRGLSGLDSALFAAVAAELLREGRSAGDKPMVMLGSLALIGFVAKCVYELTSGRTLFVEPSELFQPVPLAHLLGAVVGVFSVFNPQKPAAFSGSGDLNASSK